MESWTPLLQAGSYFDGQQTWRGYADWWNQDTQEVMFYWVIRRHESSGTLGRRIIPMAAFLPDDEDERNELTLDKRLKLLRGDDDDDD